jgi:hypothetical protein
MKIRVIIQESILGVVVGRLVWFRSWYSGHELLVLPYKIICYLHYSATVTSSGTGTITQLQLEH